MNFDELRDAWAKEPIDGGAIPALPSKKTLTAISRIRSNMRTEFVFTLIAYGLTAVFILGFARSHISILIVCAAAFMFTQAAYYFTRFFLFYRRTGRYDLSLKGSLRKIVFELELNMEVYRTYSFCVTPLACLLSLAVLDATGITNFMKLFACSDTPVGAGNLLWIIVTLLIAQVIGAFFLNLHLKLQYGSYLRDLKRTLDDLEAE